MRRRIPTALCLAVALALVPAASAEPRKLHSDRLPHADRSIRVGFWFGMSNNEILTPDMIDWIGKRASFVVLNAEEKGVHPYFDYERCVERFHEQCPGLPVLLYDWLRSDYATGEGGRVGGLSFDFLKSKTEWQLELADGSVATARGGRALNMDVTNPDYIRWHRRHVVENVRRFGTDGVAFDVTTGYLGDPVAETYLRFRNGAALHAAWADATRNALRAINDALPPEKVVLFNGFFHNRFPGRLDFQEKLVPGADAAAIEFFARNVHVPLGKKNEQADFRLLVLDLLEAMERHPDIAIPVFARSPRYVYLDYEEDYEIQRYCLASYLLGGTPLSTFKYHGHFQTGYHPPGRTYGISCYADYDLDLGAPTAARAEADGLWTRPYEKALVAVAPMHEGPKSLALEGVWFTPERERVTGRLALDEGHGAILLKECPPEPPRRIVVDDFEDGEPGPWRFPVKDDAVTVESEKGGRYLKVRSTPDPVRPYHERRVQPLRSLTVYPRVNFRIRTTDAAAAALLRVEVSDSRPAPLLRKGTANRRQPFSEEIRTPFVVLAARPEGGVFEIPETGPDIPYGQFSINVGETPYLALDGGGWKADGKWTEVSVDLAAFLKKRAPHLRPHRVSEMRLIGEADLDDLVLER